MSKRTFLMLAHNYDSSIPIGGWLASPKLDGMRAYWDGGWSRGKLASSVPFANTEKDFRYVKPPVATGLWSRYGKVIQAPDWWLNTLPLMPLDGELYMGRGRFQDVISTVKTIVPGPDWEQVQYFVFDSPPAHAMYQNGEIRETNFRKIFSNLVYEMELLPESINGGKSMPFRMVYQHLTQFPHLATNMWSVLAQEELPLNETQAQNRLNELLEAELEQGGEGIIVRNPSSFWCPNRARSVLKVKGMRDDEATVLGYIWGRETKLGSKLLGLMGAMIVDFRGKRLELSGFTDAERYLCYENGISAAPLGRIYPGKEVASEITNPRFPRGSVVTFQYRELTNDGLPKEARYWRKRELE
jgi:DNA ligase-1